VKNNGRGFCKKIGGIEDDVYVIVTNFIEETKLTDAYLTKIGQIKRV